MLNNKLSQPFISRKIANFVKWIIVAHANDIKLILTIVLSALAFVSMGANDCTDVVLHEWDTEAELMPRLVKDETGREEYDGTEKPEHLVTWVYDGTSFTPVAKVTDSERYTIVHDYLGTPTEAYDTEGNEVWSRVLDMDGNVLEETGNVGMVPFLFQGQCYDPKTGAYISQDPIGLAGGILNLYGYVSNTNAWIDFWGLAGTGGAYMFGFKSGEMYIGKGEIKRMNESIGVRSRQVQNPQLIGAAHVSTHGNNELGKMVEYKAMKNAGFERGNISSNYLNTYLSGETSWKANPSLRAEATELADKLKAAFDADVERRKRNSY